jgi:hypothetical protein
MEAVHSSEALGHLNFTMYCLVRLQGPKLDCTGLHKSLYKHKHVLDRWLNVLGYFYISNVPVGYAPFHVELWGSGDIAPFTHMMLYEGGWLPSFWMLSIRGRLQGSHLPTMQIVLWLHHNYIAQ